MKFLQGLKLLNRDWHFAGVFPLPAKGNFAGFFQPLPAKIGKNFFFGY